MRSAITIKIFKEKKKSAKRCGFLWKHPYLAFYMHRAWEKWELRTFRLLICR